MQRPAPSATDLLKPGGYLRQIECLKEIDASNSWGMSQVDVAKLEALAAKALTMDYTQKEWKSEDRIEVGGGLPLTDCYVAPCVTACAVHLLGALREHAAVIQARQAVLKGQPRQFHFGVIVAQTQ